MGVEKCLQTLLATNRDFEDDIKKGLNNNEKKFHLHTISRNIKLLQEWLHAWSVQGLDHFAGRDKHIRFPLRPHSLNHIFLAVQFNLDALNRDLKLKQCTEYLKIVHK